MPVSFLFFSVMIGLGCISIFVQSSDTFSSESQSQNVYSKMSILNTIQ